ncbi:MAG: hypothetical protein LBR60_06875 [Fibrobacter sp.]|nr:hypothetical protein [Fibrobacter sp.]
MTETGFYARKPGRKYSTPAIVIILFKSKSVLLNNCVVMLVRGNDGMFFVISMLAYPDVHFLFAIPEELGSHFLSLSAVLNTFFKTFRLEAAPICRGVLVSREHYVRQAEGGESRCGAPTGGQPGDTPTRRFIADVSLAPGSKTRMTSDCACLR